jgi:hypothetical protein
LVHYAPQKTVVHLGGVGSGKTAGQAFSFLTNALIKPHYLGLNTSISSFQATLMYEMLLPYLDTPLVAPFIRDVKRRPYPVIETIFDSKLAFMTSGYQATNIRGSEWDEINCDEFGYEYDEMTYVALRSRLRGTRPDKTTRDARMKITTTPTDSVPLRTRWDRGDEEYEEFDKYHYFSIRSTLFDNHHVSKAQRDEIVRDYTEEMVQQEIYAKFPDWGDTEFTTSQIQNCEDRLLNDLVESMDEGDPLRPILVEVPRIGATKWQMPYEPGRAYILAGDPGTGNPPRRNAGTVMVWDCTTKPYNLVYMHWISGNGSYIPWFNSFKWAYEYYKPLFKGIDATGTQKAMDELVFEREGMPVDSVNFTRDKFGMLNALKLLFQYGDLRFPWLKGLHNQLLHYKIPDDNIAQDLVSAMMVFAYLTRYLPESIRNKEVQVASVVQAAAFARRDLSIRGLRSRSRTIARRRAQR